MPPGLIQSRGCHGHDFGVWVDLMETPQTADQELPKLLRATLPLELRRVAPRAPPIEVAVRRITRCLRVRGEHARRYVAVAFIEPLAFARSHDVVNEGTRADSQEN